MRIAETTIQAHRSKLYYEFSQVYDLVFARFFYPRIAQVIRALRIPPGAKVLEVGAGTGMALSAYPSHAQVIGVDLARDMLEHAQDRIDRHGWRHVTVREMDAMNLTFADSTFDYVMAFHVVSVVPDAGRLIAEAQRVCRPGGVITVINHFKSPRPWLARITTTLDPITRWLGWTTMQQVDIFRKGALHVERQWKTSPRSLFTIVVARNAKAAPRGRTVSSSAQPEPTVAP